MRRTPADARRWMSEGTAVFLAALGRIDDRALDAVDVLPGWSGRHLVAHVAANADALANLAEWARTGAETPMYASPQQREADIEAGGRRPAGELRVWARESADRLDVALGRLDAQAWAREVRTAQGRTVPATEIPWMRAREVMVHAADLDPSLAFDDLPTDFLAALVDDIVARRSGAGVDPALRLVASGTGATWHVDGTRPAREVSAPLPLLAGWLAGRAHTLPPVDGQPVPELTPWL